MKSRFAREVLKRGRRSGMIKLDPEVASGSPVFRTPAKWIGKPRAIAASGRIQSYTSLNHSPFAQALCSPPRASYKLRAVVPWDFLLPLTLVQNNLAASEDFPALLVPQLNKKDKLPADVTLYYPKNYRLFEKISVAGKPPTRGKKKRADGAKDAATKEVPGTVRLGKLFYIGNFNLPEGIGESIGWLKKTPAVIDRIVRDDALAGSEHAKPPVKLNDNHVLSHESDPNQPDKQITFTDDRQVVFHLSLFPEQFSKEQPSVDLARRLYLYSVFRPTA